MAKLEQKARKGLYGGFKPGSTGGPGTGKVKNTIKRILMHLLIEKRLWFLQKKVKKQTTLN